MVKLFKVAVNIHSFYFILLLGAGTTPPIRESNACLYWHLRMCQDHPPTHVDVHLCSAPRSCLFSAFLEQCFQAVIKHVDFKVSNSQSKSAPHDGREWWRTFSFCV